MQSDDGKPLALSDLTLDAARQRAREQFAQDARFVQHLLYSSNDDVIVAELRVHSAREA